MNFANRNPNRFICTNQLECLKKFIVSLIVDIVDIYAGDAISKLSKKFGNEFVKKEIAAFAAESGLKFFNEFKSSIFNPN